MSKMKNICWNKAKQKSNTPKGEKKITINILVYTLLDFTQANMYIFQN